MHAVGDGEERDPQTKREKEREIGGGMTTIQTSKIHKNGVFTETDLEKGSWWEIKGERGDEGRAREWVEAGGYTIELKEGTHILIKRGGRMNV